MRIIAKDFDIVVSIAPTVNESNLLECFKQSFQGSTIEKSFRPILALSLPLKFTTR